MSVPGDRIARWLRIAAAVIGVVGFSVIGYTFANTARPELTSANVAESLDDATGFLGAESAGCTPEGRGHWMCSAGSTSDLSGATYDVHATSAHCWRARLVGNDTGKSPPRAASDCLF